MNVYMIYLYIWQWATVSWGWAVAHGVIEMAIKIVIRMLRIKEEKFQRVLEEFKEILSARDGHLNFAINFHKN